MAQPEPALRGRYLDAFKIHAIDQEIDISREHRELRVRFFNMDEHGQPANQLMGDVLGAQNSCDSVQYANQLE
jgi:hypothetical protein